MWRFFLKIINSSLISLALVVLIVFFSITSPAFSSSYNMVTLLDSVTVIAALAIGQTFVIATAGIDLSQGAVIGLSGIVGAEITMATGSLTLGCVGAFGTGLIVGLFNGLLTAFTRIPPFITTLGALSIGRGVALIITGGQPIYGLPPAVSTFGNALLSVVPVILIVVLIFGFFAHITLQHTRLGRGIFALGSNPVAAELSGLPVRRNIVFVYVISAVSASLGGILLTAYVNSALPTAGTNYELFSIAAVVIGGGSLFGGQGAVWTSILGVLLLRVLSNGTLLLGASSYAQTVILGCVVILAVFFDSFRKKSAF